MSSKDSFVSRHPWIERHTLTDAEGMPISKRYLVMKLMVQKNLLKSGQFHEAKKFGAEEGLHETTAYRLLGDAEVPQQTINDRLEEEQRLQIIPTNYRGSYAFIERPAIKPKLIHDPQTIQQIYWKDQTFKYLQEDHDADSAAELAKKKHLSFEIVRFFNAHRIYWQAIDDLDFYLAEIVNNREGLQYEPKQDFAQRLRQHFEHYEFLIKHDIVAAVEFAQAHNFKVAVVNGRRQLILTKNNRHQLAMKTPDIPMLRQVRMA